MGLLDSVIGSLAQGSGGGGGQGELLQVLMKLLSQGDGAGLGNLVSQLQQGGLAEVVNSWVSTGQNLPVSPSQLEGALGSDLIGSLASQLGRPGSDVAGGLSQLLPQLIDQLTPQGRLPDNGQLDAGQLDIGSLLGGLMGR